MFVGTGLAIVVDIGVPTLREVFGFPSLKRRITALVFEDISGAPGHGCLSHSRLLFANACLLTMGNIDKSLSKSVRSMHIVVLCHRWFLAFTQ